MTDTPPRPRLTVVAPLRDEGPNVARLVTEIGEACAPLAPFEAILVDDGSSDDTAAQVTRAQSGAPWLRLLRHEAPCGQSAAIVTGVRAARAPVVCTLDGDLQNPPAEIPRLAGPLLADPGGRLGLVAGQRVDRQDRSSRRLASRLVNGLRRAVLHDDARDAACGLKAFPRYLFLQLPVFDHMHRFLPALVRREGREVAYVDVAHRARAAGRSNYTNLGRAAVGPLDLLGVWWLRRRRRVPHVLPER